MGAHVWGPAFLRDHLLPAGPAERLDARLVRRLPRLHLLHDRAVAGDRPAQLRDPLRHRLQAGRRSAGWSACRWRRGPSAGSPGCRSRRPPLLAVGATAYLFDRSFSIYGGNIASTLAGEFSFSISLTLRRALPRRAGPRARDRARTGPGPPRCWRSPRCATSSRCSSRWPAPLVLFALQLDWSRVRWWMWAALGAVSFVGAGLLAASR